MHDALPVRPTVPDMDVNSPIVIVVYFFYIRNEWGIQCTPASQLSLYSMYVCYIYSYFIMREFLYYKLKILKVTLMFSVHHL